MSYKRLNRAIEKIKETGNEKYKNNAKAFTRKRKMDFKDFVWYLIMQKGRTTALELDEYLKNKNGTYEISISKQAFSKQRQNLKAEIFIDLNKDYLQDFYTNYPEEVKTYKGYKVCAIDGSIMEIPNTEELRKEYKAQKNGENNRETARSMVSGIYDVENEFMIDAIITKCGEVERELAKKNIEKAKEIIDIKKSIIILDRGYPGIDFIWHLEKLETKYIFRLQSKMYKKERDKMEKADEWIEINVTGNRLGKIRNEEMKRELKEKKTIKVRICKIELESGEIEYLLTNISEEEITLEEMKEVYFKRWRIEIGYDILKNKMHVENFTGRTKITVEQDFYAQIYTFNILQDIKNTNTRRIQEKTKNKKLKYKYKVNINILAGWLKNIIIAVMFTEEKERQKLYDILIEKSEKNLVAIRPDRKYERKSCATRRNKYKTNLRNNM